MPTRAARIALTTLLFSTWIGHAEPTLASVHVSLFHPLSSDPDPKAQATVSLSLIQSRIGALRGFGLHPIVSQVGDSKSGLDLVGVYSSTGGAWRGVSVTGGIAVVRGPARGLQISGLANFDQSTFDGAQIASLLNTAPGGLAGAQFATFLNVSGGPTRFLQISTVANVSEGPMKGVQFSGMNLAVDRMTGVQLGLGNVAGVSSGAQAGLFNIADEAHGLQLGAVNVANTHDGVPVGIVNRSVNDGSTEAVGFTSTLSAVNVGVRTIVNRFQSTFSVGGVDLEGDVSTAGFVSWSYGYRFPLGDRFELGADLGFSHVIPEESGDPADRDRLHFALLGRVLPEYRLSPRFAIFAGPGLATIFDEYSAHAGSETVALFTGGLVVTP